MEAAAEIPDLKFAKVGPRRERKKGGAPLWFSGAKGGGSFAGALGGAGAAGGRGLMAQLASKFAMILMVASLGAGVFGLKMAFSPHKTAAPDKPKKLFDSAPAAAQKYSGDLSSIPGGGQPSQSGLNMIQGGLGDASAQNGQGAGAAGAPQSGKDASAGADQSGQAAAPATPDPAAAIAAAAAAGANGGGAGAGRSSPFSSRFGALSSSFGSGLSGGGGMFGGVGHPFSGKLGGFGAQSAPAVAQAGSNTSSRNPATRLAARQLNNAFLGSMGGKGLAANGTLQGASYQAGAPFDVGTPAIAPGAISGPGGDQTGGAGTTPGDTASNPSGGGGGGGSNPTMGGAPQNPTSDCVQLLGPDYTNTPNGGCIQTTPTGSSADPADMMFKLIQILLAVGMILSIIQMILWLQMAAGSPFSATFIMIGKMLMGIGVLVGILGVAMAASTSHHLEGVSFAAIGGIIAASAYFGAFHQFATQIPAFIVSFIVPLTAELTGSVLSGMQSTNSSSLQ